MNFIDCSLRFFSLAMVLRLLSAASAETEWRDYLAGPQQRLNSPLGVAYFQNNDGTVSNPVDVLLEDGEAAVLTRTGPGSPLLAVDFGLPVSGKIEVVFGGTVAGPLSFAFSQRLEFLKIGSDTDTFHLGDFSAIGRPGMTWRTDLRRGFRYVLLYLPQNGMVSVDAIRVYHTPFLGRPETYDGHFLCSDDLMNRIWYGCIYTTEICTTSGFDIDGPWEAEEGWLTVSYEGENDFGFTVPGSEWSDYAMEFDFKIMPLGKVCGWAFRGADAGNNYMWQIVSTEGDHPNTLRKHVRINWEYPSIESVSLPEAVHEGEEHHVRTELEGGTIWTYLDGQLIDVTTDSTHAQGRIGFRSSGSGEHFHVDNVCVTSGEAVLFEDDFEGESLALRRDKWERAEILTINDGAKRDRVWVWGDFYPAQRAFFTAHWRPEIIAGSLRDGAEHQYTETEERRWGGILDGKIPAANAADYMRQDGWSIKWLDDYTLWWVATLHHYWMRTGDDSFLLEMYPVLQRVFGWLYRKQNAQGLSTVQQGDWYWSFLRQGGVTAFNALYVHCLRAGSEMATAVGASATDGLLWTLRADSVEAAVNEYLYDAGRQLYYDSQGDHSHYPLDANALCIVHGIAGPERAGAILDGIEALMWSPIGTRTAWPGYGTWGHDQHVWAWYVQYESEARFRMNDDLRALESIRRPWGHMVNSDPGRTMWEFMMPDGSVESGLRNTDHAFSAGGAWLLSEYVAGIRPTRSGFATYEIVPHPGGLAWVECTVPTPHGPIGIDYAIDVEGKTWDAEIRSPAGTTGRFGVPRLGEQALVLLDGSAVWTPDGPGPGSSSDDFYLYFEGLTPGPHAIRARFDEALGTGGAMQLRVY